MIKHLVWILHMKFMEIKCNPTIKDGALECKHFRAKRLVQRLTAIYAVDFLGKSFGIYQYLLIC